MRVSAFIEPCLPSSADRPPSGPDWIHEVKLEPNGAYQGSVTTTPSAVV
jgi:hypothetical protein